MRDRHIYLVCAQQFMYGERWLSGADGNVLSWKVKCPGLIPVLLKIYCLM